MTPARATEMIHEAAQWLRVSVTRTPSRRRSLANSGPSRMPMSAARSPRVIWGACSSARYSARSFSSAARSRTASSRFSTAALGSSARQSLYGLDAPADVGERRVDGQRGLERDARVALAVERQQRLTAAEQRRQVVTLDLERAVEMRERRFGILLRQLDVPERRLRRIERRRSGQGVAKLALSGLEIARLQVRPSARKRVRDRTIGERGRYRRPSEVREPP